MKQAPLRYRWAILFFGILAYGTTQFARQNFAGIQKFISADLHLDKGAIGLLASAFFYAYALFQMPWGIASDKFGSRSIVGLGTLLTAVTMAGFATGYTQGSLFFWRAAAGVAGAAVYVALTGNIARWFPSEDRGFGQATLGGVGGALGEGMAYYLLPVLSVYFASGWRQGMNMTAAVIALAGVVCIAFLRSAPAGQKATTRRPFEPGLLRDPQLWCYAFIYTGFVIGIRGTQTWMAVYAADVYISKYGTALNQAVVAGGLLAFVAYSLIGMSVNLFCLVPAAIPETYGSQRTASISSFANTLAQFSGATALAISGYVGISLNSQPGNALGDYRGIWLSGMVGMLIMAILGATMYVVVRRQRGAAPEAVSAIRASEQSR